MICSIGGMFPAFAFGEHDKKQHGSTAPRMSFTIISRTSRDELRLRINEAYEIKKRQPGLTGNKNI